MRLIDADLLEPDADYDDGEYWGYSIAQIESAQTVDLGDMWIPVSRELPEDEYVLISKKPTMLSGDKWCVTIAIRMADPRSRKIQWRDIGFDIIQDDKVLAWMPLPERYRGEKEKKDEKNETP